MRRARGVSCLFALSLAAVGCAAEPSRPSYSNNPPGDDEEDGGSDSACIDRDRDGYGRNCSKGKDCDDENPRVTDQCRRCLSIVKDCPCAAGTAPQRCVPPTIRVDGGVLVCAEGTRYCRDRYWSDCETIGEYVFQRE